MDPAGVGATIRFVPLHKLFKAVGNQLCAVLTALHRITGYDITSGVGIKKAILNAQAEKYFKHFGGTCLIYLREGGSAL